MARVSLFWLLAGIGAGALATWISDRRVFVGDTPLEGRVARGERLDKAVIGFMDASETPLVGAQLAGALIGFANMEEVDFADANLGGAVFGLTNGEEINFANARLDNAVFGLCNLEEANFSGASLRGAIFDGCVLRDATFEGADLLGAQIKNSACEGLTLPDGSDWSPATDWARFTQSGHPQFWRASV